MVCLWGDYVDQISNFSKKSGVSVQTLRYYDKMALLKPKVIGLNNYRYYSKEQLERLMVIKKLKKMGFKLQEIKAMINYCDEKTLIAHKEKLQVEIDSRVNYIKELEKVIENMKNGKLDFEKALINLTNKKERRKNMKEKYNDHKAKLQECYKLFQANNISDCLVALEELKQEMFYNEESLDSFWDNCAGDLFLGITFEVFKHNRAEDVNFLNIFDFRINGESQMNNLNDYVASLDKDSYSAICLASIVAMPDDVRLSIVSIYKQIMKGYAMFETNDLKEVGIGNRS